MLGHVLDYSWVLGLIVLALPALLEYVFNGTINLVILNAVMACGMYIGYKSTE